MKIPCALCEKNSTTLTNVVINEVLYLIPACDEHSAETRKDQKTMEKTGGVYSKYNSKHILKVVPAGTIPRKKEKEEKEEAPLEVTTAFFFSERVGYWVNSKGEEATISSLSKKEFVDAALAIAKVNFSRLTEQRAWVKKLKPEGIPIEYPQEFLDVGKRAASEKLEDFKEVAERKKWVS
jgi:hypothetical protein